MLVPNMFVPNPKDPNFNVGDIIAFESRFSQGKPTLGIILKKEKVSLFEKDNYFIGYTLYYFVEKEIMNFAHWDKYVNHLRKII